MLIKYLNIVVLFSCISEVARVLTYMALFTPMSIG